MYAIHDKRIMQQFSFHRQHQGGGDLLREKALSFCFINRNIQVSTLNFAQTLGILLQANGTVAHSSVHWHFQESNHLIKYFQVLFCFLQLQHFFTHITLLPNSSKATNLVLSPLAVSRLFSSVPEIKFAFLPRLTTLPPESSKGPPTLLPPPLCVQTI